jgi:hypothetical protein
MDVKRTICSLNSLRIVNNAVVTVFHVFVDMR